MTFMYYLTSRLIYIYIYIYIPFILYKRTPNVVLMVFLTYLMIYVHIWLYIHIYITYKYITYRYINIKCFGFGNGKIGQMIDFNQNKLFFMLNFSYSDFKKYHFFVCYMNRYMKPQYYLYRRKNRFRQSKYILFIAINK